MYTTRRTTSVSHSNLSSMNSYEILGISRTASKDDIKKAYRRLSLLYHPDVPGGNNAKFMEVKTAYEELTAIDPTKVHQQYEHRAKPFAIVVYNRINSSGDAEFHCIFKNISTVECLGKNSTISWKIMGMHVGDLKVPRHYLIDNDYCVALHCTGLDGSEVTKVYRFEDPRHPIKRFINKIKQFFK